MQPSLPGDKKPRVLLVPDLLYWVTAKMGLVIASEWKSDYEFALVSERVLFAQLKSEPDFLDQFSLIHALTPNIATRLKGLVPPSTGLIATVHHVENEQSVEPVGYADAIMTVSPSGIAICGCITPSDPNESSWRAMASARQHLPRLRPEGREVCAEPMESQSMDLLLVFPAREPAIPVIGRELMFWSG